MLPPLSPLLPLPPISGAAHCTFFQRSAFSMMALHFLSSNERSAAEAASFRAFMYRSAAWIAALTASGYFLDEESASARDSAAFFSPPHLDFILHLLSGLLEMQGEGWEKRGSRDSPQRDTLGMSPCGSRRLVCVDCGGA